MIFQTNQKNSNNNSEVYETQQRHIRNPAKHLRYSFLKKQLMAESH